MVSAAAVSAARPCTGSSFVSRSAHRFYDPPTAAAGADAHGAGAEQDHPRRHVEFRQDAPRTSTSVKAPMNFWPSLEPWLNAMSAADTI